MRLTRLTFATAMVVVPLTACGASAPAAHGHQAASTSAAAETSPAATTSAVAQNDLGTVAGRFLMAGGPIRPDGTQSRPIPLAGTLTFASGRRGVVSVRVGKSGRFSVGLPAGNYIVAGRSPSILEVLESGARVEAQCTPRIPVTVIAGRTVHVSVVCFVP